MRLFPTRQPDSAHRIVVQISVLTNIALFAIIYIVITVLSANTDPNQSVEQVAHPLLIVNVAAALTAGLVSPFVLGAYAKIQARLGRQNTELRSLHAIDTAISAELKLDPILQVAVRHATLSVDGDFGGLWLFDPAEPGRPMSQAFYNVSPGTQDLLTDYVVVNRGFSTRLIDAPQRRENLEDTWAKDPATVALKLYSAITIPIMRQDIPLGLIMIGSTRSRQGFQDDDEEMLQAVATTVGVAVQNARLYEETQRRGEMLRALVTRTGEAIAASSDAALLMQVLASEAAGILGCARVAVYELDALGERFQPLAATDNAPGSDARIAAFFRQPIPQIDVTIPAGDDVERYCENVRAKLDIDETLGEFLDRPGFLLVLRSRDNSCIGLLCLLDERMRGQSNEAIAFADALSTQTAVALENARLAEQTIKLLAQARALQTATNQIAAELDPGRVLDGVMGSARQVLDADGYAIWGQSPDERWRLRASHGLGYTVSAQQQDPREADILWQVLRERSAISIPNTLDSPLTLSFGHGTRGGERATVRALLALPLLYAGKATGVMVLYYRHAHAIAAEEISLAQSFANQAANALENARLFDELRTLYNREKHIAEELQRSLLPPLTDRVGKFQFAFQYKPGLEEAAIGGDFLDLFPLSPGKMGVVIADVSGKGLQAAVQTAMVKYTLRGFAEEVRDDPALVLERLNNVLCSKVSSLQGFVTLFFGVLDTETAEFMYANGGHEPPMVCNKAGIKHLPSVDGIALGCIPNMCFENGKIRLSPGDQVLLYTDGLTEARDEDNHFLGASDMSDIIPCDATSASEAVNEVYRRVCEFANDALRDDLALLLMRYVTEP